MNKYKEIKIPRIVTRYETVLETKRVPVWWLKFLRFVFDKDYEISESAVEAERERAFWIATGVARQKKEKLMQDKLTELGYKLVFNFPQPKEYKKGELPTIMCCRPEEIWTFEPIIELTKSK